MRFSTSVVLALPLLATAESSFDQYKAQFQNFLSSFNVKAPASGKPAGASTQYTAPDPTKEPEILTLSTWKDTLFAPVKEDATKPEEWWVLITGRNKTCYGRCEQAEAAFNETTAKFATLSHTETPHMALLNCDDEPILCGSWSCGTGSIWIFDILPRPAPVDIYRKRLNLTTTTPKTYYDLQSAKSREDEGVKPLDSVFHPFDGPFARNGISVPLAHFLYYFNMVPNWLFMLVISFGTRSMMSRRMEGRGEPRVAPVAPPAPAVAI